MTKLSLAMATPTSNKSWDYWLSAEYDSDTDSDYQLPGGDDREDDQMSVDMDGVTDELPPPL